MGDASRVNRLPRRTVSVEKVGWSDGESVKLSSIHELNATDTRRIVVMSVNMCRKVFIVNVILKACLNGIPLM